MELAACGAGAVSGTGRTSCIAVCAIQGMEDTCVIEKEGTCAFLTYTIEFAGHRVMAFKVMRMSRNGAIRMGVLA